MPTFGRVKIMLNGHAVSQSQNLRGILTYARKYGIRRVTAVNNGDGGILRVLFKNRANVSTPFADFDVLVDWISRRRGWPVPTLVHLPGATQ
jgi:hypothetical protein